MKSHLTFCEADMIAFFLNLYREEFRKECKMFDDYEDKEIDAIISKVSRIALVDNCK